MKSSFLFACLAVFCLFSVTIQQTTTTSTKPTTTTTTPTTTTTTTTTPTTTTTTPTTTTPPAIPADYTPLTADQVNKDAAAKGGRDYGSPLVVEKAIAKGVLAQDTYTISQTISSAKQVVDLGVNYKFSVTVTNAAKTVTRSIGYTVYRGNANGNYFLSKWWF